MTEEDQSQDAVSVEALLDPPRKEKIKRRDYVIAVWTTRHGDEKWVRGEVWKIAANSIWVQYYYEHNTGGSGRFGLKTIRCRKEQVTKVERLPGELLPHEYVDLRMGRKQFDGAVPIHVAIQRRLRELRTEQG